MMARRQTSVATGLLLGCLLWDAGEAVAQTPAGGSRTEQAAGGVTPPPGYVIGPDDVLDVVFWKDEQTTSRDVTVRPDGRVSLTLLNEMQAAGLTPEQFRLEVTKAAQKYLTDPVVSVQVKTINSRRVFITGMVGKPGAYSLGQPTTVLQLISLAGGLQEYAKAKDIVIIRSLPDRTETAFEFNYEDVRRGRNLQQDIELQPGDRVIVP